MIFKKIVDLWKKREIFKQKKTKIQNYN